MIEIGSRYGGKVLYTAENASDVRAALQEAIAARAYLAGAYLAGADLAGADLADANLAGANLARANLADAIWEQVASALATALQAMNDSGRHWIKGALVKPLADGSTAYCAVGSVQATSEGTVQVLALWLLGSVTAGAVENFNDFEGTTWDDIQAVFGVAIRNARRFAA